MTYQFNQQEKKHWLHSIHARPSSAVIILEDDQARALVVKANYKAHWTFPGGVIDENETPKQAALREIQEEVGLSVDPAGMQFGWVTARHSTTIDTYQFIFRAPLQPGMTDAIILQAAEIDEWRLVTKADVLSGDVHYAKTVELWASNSSEGYVEQTFGADD